MTSRYDNLGDAALEHFFETHGGTVAELLAEEILVIVSFMPIIGMPANDRDNKLTA